MAPSFSVGISFLFYIPNHDFFQNEPGLAVRKRGQNIFPLLFLSERLAAEFLEVRVECEDRPHQDATGFGSGGKDRQVVSMRSSIALADRAIS